MKDWASKHDQELNPGIEGVIRKLKQKYVLALAGNQPSGVKKLLRHYRLLDYFTSTDVSGDIGKAKPDPEFFMHILNKLEVMPGEAMMVGDRLDNDIIPAKKLGMKTVLLKVGTYSVLEPRNPGEIADAVVRTISDLPDAIADLVQ